MDDLRYPIGQFEPLLNPTPEQRNRWIEDIAEMPKILRLTVQDLTLEQLLTPYRPGGWTVQQVVHHMADNDMNALNLRWFSWNHFTVDLLLYSVHYTRQTFKGHSGVLRTE